MEATPNAHQQMNGERKCGIYKPHFLFFIYIYMYVTGYYSVVKKDKLWFAAVWMHIENILLSEVSQREKVKYSVISLFCGI